MRKRNINGFTMLEVVMAIAVLATLAAIAIPAFSSWLPEYHLKSAARDIFSNFQLAKIAAAKRNTNCTVCFNQPMEDEIFDYVVFVDADNDLEYDPGEAVIKKAHLTDYGSVGFDLTLGGGDGLTFPKNDENLPAISFRPNGLPVNNLGGLGMGTIHLTNGRGSKTCVIVSSAGNIRIS